MASLDVYLYGMILLSDIRLLVGAYPEADSYGEIKERYLVPGGETANAAILLAHFGLRVRADGPHLGALTQQAVRAGLERYGVDTSGLETPPDEPGLLDLVLVGGTTRTVFGTFGAYFSSGQRRWSLPDRASLQRARVVSLDPYFAEASELVASWCREENKPYVTLDCAPESAMHRGARITVVSREYRRREHPGEDASTLFQRYAHNTQGWTVFTSGAEPIVYGAAGEAPRRLTPFQVDVKGTLGAGDAFRAGLVYGVHQNWDADRTVSFAAALAAEVCTRFPVAADPPSLADVERRLQSSAAR